MNKQSKALLTALGVAGVVVAGCKPADQASTDMGNPSTGYGAVPTNRMAKATNAVGNTRVNVRDRAEQTLTPGDQGTTEADRDITQQIRKGLNDDSNLSTSAKNIKIITVNRKVTLRGPVNTDTEKTTVATLARSVAGEGNVDDQLEVKPGP